jgi:hypothetical protein
MIAWCREKHPAEFARYLGSCSAVCCHCHRFLGTSHIEQPCNEITGPEKEAVASEMSRVARKYFKSLVADDHSFEKPTFYLGLDDWSVTNVLPDGAHARTPGRIELLPNGLSGFSRVGDMACFALNVSARGAVLSCGDQCVFGRHICSACL